MWYWFDKSTNSWIQASESKFIEIEYQEHLNNTRHGQRVYHCFGSQLSACIDFNTMTTYCGSGRCILNHEIRKIDNNHMTYQLKRV